MMRIKDGFVMKDVAGSKVVLPIGERQEEINGIITFNDTGAEIFSMLNGAYTVEEIIEKLVKDYEVSYDVAKTDVMNIIEKMRSQGLIEE
jgi:hypothetical protein